VYSIENLLNRVLTWSVLWSVLIELKHSATIVLKTLNKAISDLNKQLGVKDGTPISKK
jgi:hypothetical protein